MSKPISSRQDVLKQLWDAPGPRAVWEILQREPAARTSGILEEIRGEARELSDFNPGGAERLLQIADEIDRIRTCCKLSAAIMQPEQRRNGKRENDGAAVVRLPLSPDQAELWFLVSKGFGKFASHLAGQIKSGARSIESCVQEGDDSLGADDPVRLCTHLSSYVAS
jgi:hypothetical protein